MAGQIVTQTNVRAEWLLCGTGPMLVTAANRVDTEFVLPPYVESVFPVFDTGLVPNTGVAMQPAAKLAEHTPMLGPDAVAAARVVHSARMAGKPVCFFLGSDSVRAGVLPLAMQFLTRQYLTSVAMTGGCVAYDLGLKNTTPHFDSNYMIRLAATQGTSIGEALGRWASSQPSSSLLAATVNSRTPVTVHMEVGELPEHLNPAPRGAELGAAIGAASYVDMLIFTEQVRKFAGTAGGVLVLLGEPDRGLRLFLQAVHAVRAIPPESESLTPRLTEFSVILLSANEQPDIQSQVTRQGGRFYFVRGAYQAAASNLLAACTAVYDGKILNDNKPTT